jgi:hypothetical protein
MKIQINAAVVDTSEMILYCVDGTTHKIKQGDPMLSRIIKDIIPILSANKIAEIDLNNYVEKRVNTFKHHEENSSGIVKFFKVAKKHLNAFFKSGEEKQTQVEVVPPVTVSVKVLDKPLEPEKETTMAVEDSKWVNEMIAKIVDKESEIAAKKVLSVVEEIVQHAIPTSSPEFNNPLSQDETIIAVVNNMVIDNVEMIKSQIQAASELKNYAGIDKFLERVSAVSSKYRHSVEDLMRFMEKGDLPIADDGSIIIYKILNKSGNHFVDCYTGKVPQKVGSYVCMDKSLIDHDRRIECSSGLHVARRSYLSSFSGNSCVIAKVNPEDVIAVPLGTPNKMRVCGYHIIFQLSDEAFKLAKSGKSFTEGEDAKRILGKAISGDHIGKIENVLITGQKGTGIVITPLMTKTEVADSVANNLTTSVDPVVQTVDKILVGPATLINPKALAKIVTENTATAIEEKAVVTVKTPVIIKAKSEPKEKAKTLTRAEKAKALYTKSKQAKGRERTLLASELLEYKARAKVSWASLGITEKQVSELKNWAN